MKLKVHSVLILATTLDIELTETGVATTLGDLDFNRRMFLVTQDGELAEDLRDKLGDLAAHRVLVAALEGLAGHMERAARSTPPMATQPPGSA